MAQHTQFLIVGAGPYGLAAGAHAQHQGLDTLIVGQPMSFWQRHMPQGMLLRSPAEWHLDPVGVHTLAAYRREKGLSPDPTGPIPVEFFLDYAAWFQTRANLRVQAASVRALERADGRFRADVESGETILADKVLVAPGMQYFAHLPADLIDRIPPGLYSHTSQMVDFEALRDRRCLIIGGRQSAFEWAALIAEAGGAEVHIAYRHDTPRFEASDWGWVDGLIRATEQIPGWFRRLPGAEQEAIRQQFWDRGRLKLEPWLGPRIHRPNIHLWPKSSVTGWGRTPSGDVQVTLDTGATLTVDHIVLATGYRVNVRQVPYLSAGSLLRDLHVLDGFPALDEHFQSSIPGLFFTGVVAARDFGPFMGFVIAARASARLIVDRILRDTNGHGIAS